MGNPAMQAFDPIPSYRRKVSVTVASALPRVEEAGAVAVPVDATTSDVVVSGLDRRALSAAGFEGKRGQTLVIPSTGGRVVVAVGIGTGETVSTAFVRELAADFARAVPHQLQLAVQVPVAPLALAPADFAQAVTEGVLLARWRFYLGKGHEESLLDSLVIVAPEQATDEVSEGVRIGVALSRASNLGRDLANCPAATLSAERMAAVAHELGSEAGLEVQAFGKAQLIEMDCGGLLGVNLGSVQPPQLIRLHYKPESPTGRLAFVGKGIMYDSGGISLKPSDESHAQMKNDMTGAAAVLASMTVLRTLGCTTEVIGYLCCTDNMPSGTALKLGDVLTMRNGTTVEVLNTDAEGRLVMADGLALSVEDGVDAIVDIATLTGACLRTFGVDLAGVMGNDTRIVAQVKDAGALVDEPVWELPLHRPYREQLTSPVADMTNMGGANAGSITAGLFLEEFVDGLPWAHIDIAGTAQLPAARNWRNKGATGFGTRLLAELAVNFRLSPATSTDGR
jgi:leucyl aminopeptidase